MAYGMAMYIQHVFVKNKSGIKLILLGPIRSKKNAQRGAWSVLQLLAEKVTRSNWSLSGNGDVYYLSLWSRAPNPFLAITHQLICLGGGRGHAVHAVT